MSNQSEVFKSMLSDGCGSMIEASTGEIKIKDISTDTMESLLYFLYFDHENLKGKLLLVKLLHGVQRQTFTTTTTSFYEMLNERLICQSKFNLKCLPLDTLYSPDKIIRADNLFQLHQK